jgi:hypothetical protein
MTSFLRWLAASACLVLATSPTLAAYDQCSVDDPTGSLLNVRSAPNGTILSTLANGTQVEVVDEMRMGPKRWLFIARNGERLGWVFGAYVVCMQPGDAREAAPSQPTEQR